MGFCELKLTRCRLGSTAACHYRSRCVLNRLGSATDLTYWVTLQWFLLCVARLRQGGRP